MKRFLSVLFAFLLLSAGLTVPAVRADHTHSGVLQSVKTDAGQSVPCCGVFRCSECGATYEDTITGKNAGLPVVKLEGELDGMTKERKVTVRLTFDAADRSFVTNATLKWQGDTSLKYPKKNYSVAFLTDSGLKNKICVRDDWGRQSKYCLKANWVDYSACRNIVSARLWGQVVHSELADDTPDSLLNGGAIDGFPVLLFQNGGFQGLYTFNMPKDKWIYGMGDGEREGLMMANGFGSSCCMYTPIADLSNPDASQWEVEYCSTEDDPEGSVWLAAALNDMINCVATLDGQALKDALPRYMDVDRALDFILFITVLRAEDNRGKNIMWATYDGVRFTPLAYDLEGSWGMNWNGTFVGSDAAAYPPPSDTMFLDKMLRNYAEELKARYAELRQGAFSYRNISLLFHEYADAIPACAYEAEKSRWPDQPGIRRNTAAQARTFAYNHLLWLDSYFGVSVEEKTDRAYRAAFTCLNGAKVWGRQSADGGFNRAAEAFSADAAGNLTKSGGQIVFRADVPEGTVPSVSVSPAGAYAALQGPAETGEANVWRVTGISNELTVRVAAVPDLENAEGYNVTFVCPAGARVLVYPGQDYGAAPTQTLSAVSADGDTGAPTKDGGQLNFLVVSDDADATFKVSASPKKYKKLKGFEETGVRNLFRMTKISGDMTVTVELDGTHAHAYSYTCAQIPGNANAHRCFCACGRAAEEAHVFGRINENGVTRGICEKCGYVTTMATCTHICHSTNTFFRLIWKIELFFFKTFKIHRTCECGAAHY